MACNISTKVRTMLKGENGHAFFLVNIKTVPRKVQRIKVSFIEARFKITPRCDATFEQETTTVLLCAYKGQFVY